MNKKKLMSLLISLNLITTNVAALTGCNEKKDGYVLEMHDDSLVVYEATDIHSSDSDMLHQTVFSLKNGEEYSLDDSICIVTKSKKEADNYYNMFNSHQSTIQNARYTDEKEKTYFVMEIINNNLIIYEAKSFYFDTTIFLMMK